MFTYLSNFILSYFIFFLLFLISGNSEPDGISILFDGQKQYPSAKVTVDFTFVEHTEFDCIEIIGICIPFESINKMMSNEKGSSNDNNTFSNDNINNSNDNNTISDDTNDNYNDINNSNNNSNNNINITYDNLKITSPKNTDFSISSFNSPFRSKGIESKNLEYLFSSGKATIGLYNMTLDEKQSLPIIRVFIAAKVFYERIITNKKVKDKKNRRVEQVMTVRSKLTQNMAAQSLLGNSDLFIDYLYVRIFVSLFFYVRLCSCIFIYLYLFLHIRINLLNYVYY